MKRLFVVLLLVALVCLGFVGFGALRGNAKAASTALPTVAEIPSATDTDTPVPTDTPTSTLTFTPSPTDTPTPTYTLTPSMTLATRVLVVTAISPALARVAQQATDTLTPLPTFSAPTPPSSIALLPTGDAPVTGWFEHDITDAAIQLQGKWDTFTATYRSANKRYLYSDDDKARLTLRFQGAAVRVRYVAYFSYGVFSVLIDGQVRTTVDSYYAQQASGRGNFVSTEVFGLANGWHTLEIVRLGRKAPESQGTMIALDAIDVYLAGPVPTPGPTTLPTLTASPAPAQQIALVNAPPTVQPTITQVAPRVVSVSLIIAYDQDNNHSVGPNEGVSGIPVRLVTVGTNQVIASGYTNGDGYVHVEAMTDAPVRLVVPYFSKFWDVTGDQHITLLIPAGNQPSLIP